MVLIVSNKKSGRQMMDKGGKTARVRRFQWISVVLLMAVGIVFILDRSTLAIANQNVSSDLRLSPTQMGLLLSAFSWAYAFSQLPLGMLLDRIGARIVLGAGILLWAAAQAFTGLINSLPQFLAARVCLGVGEAPIFPSGAKVIADWFNKSERGGPTGIFLASTTIGPVIAPPIITALMLSLGWRDMYIALGVFGLALSAIWYLVARDHRDVILAAEDAAYFEEDGAAAGQKLSFADLGGLLGQRSTWGIICGFVGVIYMIWLYLTWLPVYLEHERHFSIKSVGWILSIPYIFGTLGSISSGYLADHLLKRGLTAINSRKYPICVGLLGAAAFTIPVAYTPDAIVAVGYLCVVMFFLYIASAGAWALVNVVAPRSRIATLGALQNFGGYFGGSFAPIITGWLLQDTHSFKSALMMSSAVAFAAALLYFILVRKPIEDTTQITPAIP
jgi:sugar phosphate permease